MTWAVRSSAPSASCRWHITEECKWQTRETRSHPGEAVQPWGPHEVQVQVQGAAAGLGQPPVSIWAGGWTDLVHQSKRGLFCLWKMLPNPVWICPRKAVGLIFFFLLSTFPYQPTCQLFLVFCFKFLEEPPCQRVKKWEKTKQLLSNWRYARFLTISTR